MKRQWRSPAADGQEDVREFSSLRASELGRFAHLQYRRSSEERRAGTGSPDVYDQLAHLAEREDWDGPGPRYPQEMGVLKQYLSDTFQQALHEGKVFLSTDERLSVFNSGLATPRQEAIYGLFTPNRVSGQQPWYLRGWRPESNQQLLWAFPELPGAVGFSDPAHYNFDRRLRLEANTQFLAEHQPRQFPVPLRNDPCGLEMRLSAEVARAHEAARTHCSVPVPAWHAARQEVQLLLPLCLVSPDRPDAALALSRAGDHYQAISVLPLQTAYCCARLLGRPAASWLNGTL
ncbi:DUF3825 domain-containing protein [Streptomyces sp. NPDC056672]|uniref:DUF3825 domain-containing protein n=1 Tax=Streptomyces sp. NPDC056672 TaxID=3345906 RepID=UPI003689C72A